MMQEQHWRPLIDWMNGRFNDLHLKVQHDINVVDNNNRKSSSKSDTNKKNLINVNYESPSSKFDRFLVESLDINSLIAFNYMCECLKSVILSVALIERRVKTVEEACELSFLEQKHQYDQWGKVEWYHDINESELRSRVSAALLFIYLTNSSKYFNNHKKIQKEE